MSNETRDPREAVMRKILQEAMTAGVNSHPTRVHSRARPPVTATALARLDAADPRLAMWGEMVEALEYIARATYGTELSQTPEEQLSVIWGHFSAHQRKARDLLNRARALDATTGETK